MRYIGWKQVLVVGLVCTVAMTGCKKRGAGAGADGDNIGGVLGSDIYGEGLDARPGDGASLQEGRFSSIFFAYDSAQVQPSERAILEEVGRYLQQKRSEGLIVEGHCDERGSREYNLALGERRALAARAYLIGLGIDGGRIQTKSLGEEQPASMGHDEGAWSQNRRAEFVLFY